MNSHAKSFKVFTRLLSENQDPKELAKLRKEISQQNIIWEEVIAIANNELLTPALWLALKRKHLSNDIPLDLQEYLQELYTLNLQRNRKLKAQALEVIEVIEVINKINIRPVMLKGCSYLLLDVFNDLGARIMYDLDILVPANKLASCLSALKAEGYHTDAEDEIRLAKHHHWAPLFKPGEYAAIELHKDLLSHSAAHVLSTAEVWPQIISIPLENYSVSVLSASHRVLHSILHAQVVDRFHERHIIKLRSIYDLVNIVNYEREKIDWAYIHKLMKQHGMSHVLRSHLYSAHKILGLKMPIEIRPGLTSRYHYLRCIAAIRWDWFLTLEKKLLRFSRYEICRYYHCEDQWLIVTVKRMQYSLEVLHRKMKTLISWSSK